MGKVKVLPTRLFTTGGSMALLVSLETEVFANVILNKDDTQDLMDLAAASKHPTLMAAGRNAQNRGEPGFIYRWYMESGANGVCRTKVKIEEINVIILTWECLDVPAKFKAFWVDVREQIYMFQYNEE